MPIDTDKLFAYEKSWDASWTAQDVVLYHLGVGAGDPPTDPGELAYTYEPKLKVLPSFGVVPAFLPIPEFVQIPGLDVNFAMLLHGEQETAVHGPVPTEATATSTIRPVALYDKGKGALLVNEVVTSVDGQPVFTNQMSAFIRGEGGFGGDSGPANPVVIPDREPDLVVASRTLPQQALLYRLNGDANPLHADPDFAKLGGFDRPILHGLCTYGVVCKAAVDAALDGDVTRVTGYRARFTGVVYPGETIATRIWREDGELLLEATVPDRDATVLSNGQLTLTA